MISFSTVADKRKNIDVCQNKMKFFFMFFSSSSHKYSKSRISFRATKRHYIDTVCMTKKILLRFAAKVTTAKR